VELENRMARLHRARMALSERMLIPEITSGSRTRRSRAEATEYSRALEQLISIVCKVTGHEQRFMTSVSKKLTNIVRRAKLRGY